MTPGLILPTVKVCVGFRNAIVDAIDEKGEQITGGRQIHPDVLIIALWSVLTDVIDAYFAGTATQLEAWSTIEDLCNSEMEKLKN